MSRRDNFNEGHGNENHWLQPIGPEEMQELLAVGRASETRAAWNKERHQAPVDISDRIALQAHLVDAHGVSPDDTMLYNEGAHDSIPALANRKRNWSGPTVPELDHTDLHHMHTHEHNEGEYADDYPHTTMGSSHFHH